MCSGAGDQADAEPAGRSKYSVPKHLVKVSHSRSSGPGGQNVNKVATKVDLRVDMSDTSWLPPDVHARFLVEAKSHLVKSGLLIQCDETRSQVIGHVPYTLHDTITHQIVGHVPYTTLYYTITHQTRNLFLAHRRLQRMLDKAAVVPKERVISLEPPTHIKARRKDAKQHASKKKQSRRGGVPAF